MSNQEKTELIPWDVLNYEGKYLLDRVESEWITLLDDDTLPEETYHHFLAKYAGLFLWDGGIGRPVVISKLRFGADWVTDFVMITEGASRGWFYELVEIETPHRMPYNKDGTPSARLTRAIQQVHDWKIWLQANPVEAKRLFPDTGFPFLHFLVVIGRRKENDTTLPLRNYLAEELRIEIRSFDWFTDNFRQRTFRSTPIISDAEFQGHTLETANKVANPFYKAYSDETWRKIVSHPKFFSVAHLFSRNAKLLLEHREYNDLLQEFLSLWESLPPDKQQHYLRRVH